MLPYLHWQINIKGKEVVDNPQEKFLERLENLILCFIMNNMEKWSYVVSLFVLLVTQLC